MKSLQQMVRKAAASVFSVLILFSSISTEAWCAAPVKPSTSTRPAPKSIPGLSPKQRAAKFTAVKRAAKFSTAPTDAEIMSTRVLSQMLVPTSGSAVAGENAALASALTAFAAKRSSEDVTPLTNFSKTHPTSRWRAALDLNIGLERYQTGYFSDALTYWKSAWNLSQNDKGALAQRMVAEPAIGNLVMLEARLGRTQDLQNHISSLGGKPLHGAAATILDSAKGGLWAQQHASNIAFKCGPYAVNTLLYLNQPTKGIDPRLKSFASTRQGTNLAQVKELADSVGLKYQMAKRSKGAQVIFPSVMHLAIGHFAAITDSDNGKFRLQDPTFDVRGSLWLSQNAIDTQSDGYFLVPVGALPSGWQPVSKEDALKVWGRGYSSGRAPHTPNDPKGCPSGMCCPAGLPSAFAWTMQSDLNIVDVPLSYNPPIGPTMAFRLNYNQNEDAQSLSTTNLSAWWTLNWSSYLSLDASKNATVHVRGGGEEIYNFTFPDNVTNPYPPNLMSQAILTVLAEGVYQRLLPDGSIEVFSLSDGGTPETIYLTAVIDPQGNAATVSYDANFRITSIIDANGFPTKLTYLSNTVANPGFYLVSAITDPFGRAATFGYDSTSTYLTSITDAVGNNTTFTYADNSSVISGMTTPYGQTLFYTYTPQGDAPFPPRGLRFTFPDGTTSVIENWIGENKTTYFWDREAMALYPNDPINQNYTHCVTTKFLFDASTNNESAVINWVKPPLEAQVTYLYEGETGDNYIGVSNKPIRITRYLSGNVAQLATIGGAPTAGDVLTLTVLDSGLTGGQQSVSYTVTSTDTLTTIASGLASAINNSANLQAIGVTGTASGATVRIQSASANPTTYSQSASMDATETISIVPSSNPAYKVTVGGTITAGDTVSITVHDAGLPAGELTVPYVIQTGDTAADVAAALGASINANVTLQSLGISAASAATVLNLQSYSSNTTTYTATASGGATLAIDSAVVRQVWSYQYNAFGKLTQSVDPIGRTVNYLYSANNVDLLEVREATAGDNFLLGKWEYNSQHRPVLAIDGSGQRTQIAYNAAGQVYGVVNALPSENSIIYTYTTLTPVTVGGTISAGRALKLTISWTTGSIDLNYTTVSGDTAASIAAQFASQINANPTLQTGGMTAFSSGGVIGISAPSFFSYATTVAGAITMAVGTTTSAYMIQARGPMTGAQSTSLTWNFTGTVSSITDSQGYKLVFSYDNLDRLTKTTYPDGTSEQTVWQVLDPIFSIDVLPGNRSVAKQKVA